MIGGTDINRLYSLTGTCDPDGGDGGCQFLDTKIGSIQSPGADLGTGGRWKPYPQVLTEAGISWKCYGTARPPRRRGASNNTGKGTGLPVIAEAAIGAALVAGAWWMRRRRQEAV